MCGMSMLLFNNLLELLKVSVVCLAFHQLFVHQMNKLWLHALFLFVCVCLPLTHTHIPNKSIIDKMVSENRYNCH